MIDDKADTLIDMQADAIERKLKQKSDITVHDFGLCKTCGHLNYMSYESGAWEAWCERYDREPRALTAKDKIVRCLNFYRKGETSLDSMKEIAWEIKIKDAVGFQRKD